MPTTPWTPPKKVERFSYLTPTPLYESNYGKLRGVFRNYYAGNDFKSKYLKIYVFLVKEGEITETPIDIWGHLEGSKSRHSKRIWVSPDCSSFQGQLPTRRQTKNWPLFKSDAT